MFGLTSISFLSQIMSACRLGSGGQCDTCLKCLFLHVFLDEFLLQRVAAIAGTAHLLLNTHLPFLQGLASPWTISSVQLSLDRSAAGDPLLYFHSSRCHFTSLKHFLFSYLHSEYEAKRGIIFEEFFPINLFVFSSKTLYEEKLPN